MAPDFPSIYLLPTHLSLEARRELEGRIPSLTHDITEAEVILGKVATKQRAQFELRSRRLWTEEIAPGSTTASGDGRNGFPPSTTPKRRRVGIEDGLEVELVDLSTESEIERAPETTNVEVPPSREKARSCDSITLPPTTPPANVSSPIGLSPESLAKRSTAQGAGTEWGDAVRVVKLSWLDDCLAAGDLVPFGNHLVYEGRLTQRLISARQIIAKSSKRIARSPKDISPRVILARAAADAPRVASTTLPMSRRADHRRVHLHHAITRPTHLLRQTTSEHDDLEELPPIPSYLHTIYSCERPTPLHPPNETFISQLKKIRKSRELIGDDVGIRAYSTAIATLSAYPYTLTSAREVSALPGCSQRIAALYQEWKDNGHIRDVEDIDSDQRMQILSAFYIIFGVGPVKAREFYSKGWVDLDDVIAYGWETLTRVQQIGLKYYDDFQLRIPRAEIEFIGGKILEYANCIHPGFQMCIVGGYRRGKDECGDADIVLSHPDENVTLGFIQEIVMALGVDGWIKHTLEVSLANTRRGQTPVSWKGNIGVRVGGFDTLDKALVVWQDQRWPTRADDLEKGPDAKNPAVLRRVDIVITPWKTAGCAVAGWSGGTTFQRDMRRYATKVRHLKFDSTGVRSRLDGHWVDLESKDGKMAPDLLTAERRVFAGLGLEWREPWERCTG